MYIRMSWIIQRTSCYSWKYLVKPQKTHSQPLRGRPFTILTSIHNLSVHEIGWFPGFPCPVPGRVGCTFLWAVPLSIFYVLGCQFLRNLILICLWFDSYLSSWAHSTVNLKGDRFVGRCGVTPCNRHQLRCC